MKLNKLIYISFLAIGLLVISCKPDKKDDPTAPTTPVTDARDKFIANWNVSENSTTSTTPNTYTVNITKSGSLSNAVIIENFYGLNTYTVYANISNSTLTIPYQQVRNNTAATIGFAAGSGTLTTASKINLTYTTTISVNKDSCTSVYTK